MVKQVTLTYFEELGNWVAECAEMTGLIAIAETLKELQGNVHCALQDYFDNPDLTFVEKVLDTVPAN